LFLSNLFFIVIVLILSVIVLFFFLHCYTSSHWFIYFLLLVYLGGVLIILLYLASITSYLESKYKIRIIILLFLFFIFWLFLSNTNKTIMFSFYGSIVLTQPQYFMFLLGFIFVLVLRIIWYRKFLLFKNLPLRML